MKHSLEWAVGFAPGPDDTPLEFVPARVPGAVQLDWASAHDWPSYTYGDNYKAYEWMEDVFWVYRAALDPPARAAGERLFFVCKGVDYRFQVRLGGEVLHDQEGMFTPFEIDLTEEAGDVLEVVVWPAPKSQATPQDRAQANQSCKPAVSYGWDWHPRLIPLGIWDETYLETRPRVHLQDVETTYELADDFSRVEVTLTARLSEGGPGRLHWTLLDRWGKVVLDRSKAVGRILLGRREDEDVDADTLTLRGALNQPILWWPNGEGEPRLYLSRAELLDANGAVTQTWERKIGFRRVRLVMHEGAWEQPDGFPKSRSTPPITLEVNGRRIFARGSNWVNPEIFPGTITAETYRPLLQLAQDAHFNLLRVWGGGIVNKDSFWDECDERGLLVWQEFPLACNDYAATPAYLRVLDQESRSIIQRLRSRASLGLWCGGNELFNAWSGMTDQSLALRLLNRNCYDLDPATPFLPTAPLMGMAHGNYLFRYADGREVFQVLPNSSATAYTEFGCPGPSPAEYLKTFIPPQDLFPPRPGTAWEDHHAFGAWVGDTWLQPGVIEDYFGPSADLEALCAGGEWLQCEGYHCLFEEARRQKPVCAMALNWCYNEPWPSAANNSLINWPAQPKPAYYAVQASCRPTLASARLQKFAWAEGETFAPELWLLHDGPDGLGPGRIEAFLEMGGEETFLLGWDHGGTRANENLAGPTLRFRLPHADAQEMTLRLRAVERPEWDSEYRLSYRAKGEGRDEGVRVLNI